MTISDYTMAKSNTLSTDHLYMQVADGIEKMIDEEDATKPLTDDQIAAMLQRQGIQVTRRTVAKYREDLKIPSTHHRRERN